MEGRKGGELAGSTSEEGELEGWFSIFAHLCTFIFLFLLFFPHRLTDFLTPEGVPQRLKKEREK